MQECTCTEVTPFLCPEFQRNFTAYRNRFRMPWRESGGVQVRYISNQSSSHSTSTCVNREDEA